MKSQLSNAVDAISLKALLIFQKKLSVAFPGHETLILLSNDAFNAYTTGLRSAP